MLRTLVLAVLLIGGATLDRPAVAQRKGKSRKLATPTASVVLTRADFALLVADQSEESRKKLLSDPAARIDFAKTIHTILAVAEEARRVGFAARSDQKRLLDYTRARVIAETYFTTHKEEVTPAEIEAFFKEPGKQAFFEQLMADAVKEGSPQQFPAEEIAAFKDALGKTLIRERRGVAAGLPKQRLVQLNILLMQARGLAVRYAEQELQAQTKPTESEIDAYLVSHPDVNDQKDREQAEAILRRLQNGEDFANLARQFSIDGSRDSGGDLGWFGRGVMVEEFEKAAFALQPGQLSGVVKTMFGYHILKVEERRTVKKQGVSEEEVHARHILISSGKLNPYEALKSPRDRARDALQTEKQQRVFDEIVKRSKVIVPSDLPAKPSRGRSSANKSNK